MPKLTILSINNDKIEFWKRLAQILKILYSFDDPAMAIQYNVLDLCVSWNGTENTCWLWSY